MSTKIILGLRPSWFDVMNKYKYPDNFIMDRLNDLPKLLAHKPQIIIPIFLDHCYFLDNNRKVLEQHNIKFLSPTFNAIDTFDDKLKFHNFMVQNNFGHLTPKKLDKLEPPCIVKKTRSDYGIGTYIVTSADKVPKTIDWNLSIILEPIKGKEEYSGHFLVKDGDIKFHIIYKSLFHMDLFIHGHQHKPYGRIKVDIEAHILDPFKQIMKAINFTGVCCANYKIVNNLPIIFEINPRFGGSLIGIEDDLQVFINEYLTCSA
jgi:carbamoylphosphate synthase large subunit